MALDNGQVEGSKPLLKLGLTVEEVEKATGVKVATLEGYYPIDLEDRPLRIKATGQEGSVVGYDGDGDVAGGNVWVQPLMPYGVGPYRGAAMWREEGEVVFVSLDECVPLCSHCQQPLVESEFQGPGECRNATCFLAAGTSEKGEPEVKFYRTNEAGTKLRG